MLFIRGVDWMLFCPVWCACKRRQSEGVRLTEVLRVSMFGGPYTARQWFLFMNKARATFVFIKLISIFIAHTLWGLFRCTITKVRNKQQTSYLKTAFCVIIKRKARASYGIYYQGWKNVISFNSRI